MRRSTILILGAAGCFAAYVFYGLVEVEPVKVKDVKMVHTGDQVFVQGQLRNTGADSGPLAIEVRLFDRGGHKVAVDTVRIEALKSGAETPFSSPPRPSGEVSDYSIDLNHGRNAYGN